MSILDHTPTLHSENAIQIAQSFFGLHATAKPLPSERDQNFLLQTNSGKLFGLKIANGLEELAMLKAQNQVMGYLAKSIAFCQQVLHTKNGEEIATVESLADHKYFARLVTYLPGTPLGNVKFHTDELLNVLLA